MTANCDRAKQLVSKIPSSETGQLLVKTCCGGSSEECLEKMSAMAAEVYCMSQTGGACQKCCAFVANKAAKVLMLALQKAGIASVIADFWDVGNGIVGMFIPPGSCNFGPDLAAVLAKSRQYARAKAEALSNTWVDIHNELNIQIPPNARAEQLVSVHFNLKPSRNRTLMWPLIWGWKSEYSQDVQTVTTWEYLLINRALQGGNHSIYITADSSYGSLYTPPLPSPEQSKTVGIDQFVDAKKDHWRCDMQPKFIEALKRAMNYKLNAIDEAYNELSSEMAILMSQAAEVQAEKLQAAEAQARKLQAAAQSSPQALQPGPESDATAKLATFRLFQSEITRQKAASEQRKMKIALGVAAAAGLGAYLLYRQRA